MELQDRSVALATRRAGEWTSLGARWRLWLSGQWPSIRLPGRSSIAGRRPPELTVGLPHLVVSRPTAMQTAVAPSSAIADSSSADYCVAAPRPGPYPTAGLGWAGPGPARLGHGRASGRPSARIRAARCGAMTATTVPPTVA